MASVSFTLSIPNAVLSVRVIHKDLVEVTFSKSAVVDTTLKSLSNYSVVSVDSSHTVAIKKVLPPLEALTTTVIRIVTEPQIAGLDYALSIDSINFVDKSNDAGYKVFKARHTKASSILNSLPDHYSRSPESIVRVITEAIGMEDDLIGGSLEEDPT